MGADGDDVRLQVAAQRLADHRRPVRQATRCRRPTPARSSRWRSRRPGPATPAAPRCRLPSASRGRLRARVVAVRGHVVRLGGTGHQRDSQGGWVHDGDRRDLEQSLRPPSSTSGTGQGPRSPARPRWSTGPTEADASQSLTVVVTASKSGWTDGSATTAAVVVAKLTSTTPRCSCRLLLKPGKKSKLTVTGHRDRVDGSLRHAGRQGRHEDHQEGDALAGQARQDHHQARRFQGRQAQAEGHLQRQRGDHRVEDARC